MPLKDTGDMPDSDGVCFIIEEAMKEDERPLYVLLQGCLTDLAVALNRKPESGERLTAVWIGGDAYPVGGSEFNLTQDPEAVRSSLQKEEPSLFRRRTVKIFRYVVVEFKNP